MAMLPNFKILAYITRTFQAIPFGIPPEEFPENELIIVKWDQNGTSLILLCRRSRVSNFFKDERLSGIVERLFCKNGERAENLEIPKNFAKAEDAQIDEMTQLGWQTGQLVLNWEELFPNSFQKSKKFPLCRRKVQSIVLRFGWKLECWSAKQQKWVFRGERGKTSDEFRSSLVSQASLHLTSSLFMS